MSTDASNQSNDRRRKKSAWARPDQSELLFRTASAATKWLEPFARYAAYAQLVTTGIRSEALMRRTWGRQQELLWGAYGRRSPLGDARLRERGLAPTRPVARSGDIDHVPINWHEGGDGPALLLLNGWTASGIMWPSRWLSQLEERYRVIRPDNRASGWSRNADVPFTIADMADDVAALLRAAVVGPVPIIGLSMGGMIAQELAIRHAHLVDRLVLVGTRPPAPAHIAPPSEVLRAAMALPGDEPLEEYFAKMWGRFCAPGFAEDHPALMDELVEQILRRPTPRQLVLTQLRAIAGWNEPHRLNWIHQPTVVVHGDADRLMPVGNGIRLAHLIPHARYIELPGVGHMVPLEAPDALTEVIDGPLGASRS